MIPVPATQNLSSQELSADLNTNGVSSNGDIKTFNGMLKYNDKEFSSLAEFNSFLQTQLKQLSEISFKMEKNSVVDKAFGKLATNMKQDRIKEAGLQDLLDALTEKAKVNSGQLSVNDIQQVEGIAQSLGVNLDLSALEGVSVQV